MGIGRTARQWIRRNRQAPLARAAAAVAEKYLRAWHNEAFFEFDHNGEGFVLDQFARWSARRDIVVWDVGAHDGHWAQRAHRLLPTAAIHSFEIVPDTLARLQHRLGGQPWSIIHGTGLSDHQGSIEVGFNSSDTTTSAIAPRLEHHLFAGGIRTVTCPITTADQLAESGVPRPNFLKIDVEGHEAAVLRGARAMLADDGPALIQFEYGDTWLPSSETMRATHALLSAKGYRVGRIFPNHVAFKPYHTADDHFRMGNYVAVRDPGLALMLSGKGR